VSLLVGADGQFTGQVVIHGGETSSGLSGTLDERGTLDGALEQFRLQGHLQLGGTGRASGSTRQMLNEATVGTITVDLERR
jgi:hypothetical protein